MALVEKQDSSQAMNSILHFVLDQASGRKQEIQLQPSHRVLVSQPLVVLIVMKKGFAGRGHALLRWERRPTFVKQYMRDIKNERPKPKKRQQGG